MLTIKEFPFPMDETGKFDPFDQPYVIPIPRTALIVGALWLVDRPVLVALCQPDEPTHDVTFYILASGEQIPDPAKVGDLRPLGTVVGGDMLWHIFQVLPKQLLERPVPAGALPYPHGFGVTNR
jgi:hypothetical protein